LVTLANTDLYNIARPLSRTNLTKDLRDDRRHTSLNSQDGAHIDEELEKLEMSEKVKVQKLEETKYDSGLTSSLSQEQKNVRFHL
jgi:hypothetical protein